MSSTLAKALIGRSATPSVFTRTFMLGIVGSLAAYLTSWENADRIKDNYAERNRNTGDTFDFIVVGGGTAGVILANRLSVKYKTLLLEAGGEPHPFQNVPLLSNFLMNYPELDWRHVTMPQKQGFLGSIQSRASISQGRGLGGTSNMDFLMFLRGHPLDYGNWAEITGDSSWSYDSLAKYFKSLEQYTGPWQGKNHGESGELKIKQPSFTGFGKQFCHAAQQNGYKHTDLNAAYNEGCDILTYPTKRGYRDSVYSSFYKQIKNRLNLVVNKYAHVNKILIRGNDNSAYAVEYDRHGKTHIAYAKKEVVVSAGAIQTPKLLLLSGIGLKSDLDLLGIPVVADLPVGMNLQDHLSVFLGPFFVESGKSLDIDRDVSASAVLSLAKDKGPLTTTGYQAAAVISSGLEKLHGARNWPDLQLTMYGLAHQKSADEDFSHAFKIKKDLLRDYFQHSKGRDSFSILVTVGRPKSTGSVKLLNRNPYAPLIINPNYFDKIYDVVVMVDGIKKALKIVENSTVFYNELNTRFTQKVLPGCEKFRFRSDAYFECYARTLTISLGNVAGTAALGSVLNSKMQVKGLKGLRIIDASVMPSIVSTSTGATVMMIAEKGADLILKEWNGSGSEAEEVKYAYSSTAAPPPPALIKTKEASNPLKFGTSPANALMGLLKLGPAFGKSNSSATSLNSLSIADIQKLTKTVGSLASLLDPVLASESRQPKKVYTGSFNIDGSKTKSANKSATVTQSPLQAMLTLTPILKSQFGGLYQNYFSGEGDDEDGISITEAKKGEEDLLLKLMSGLNIPGLSGNATTKGKPLGQSNSFDALKIIQGMIDKNMKDLKELEHLDKIKAIGKGQLSSQEKAMNSLKKINMTLDDIFGMAEGLQDELEDYESEEESLLPISTKTKTSTEKSAKEVVKVYSTKVTVSTSSSTTTAKPKPTTTERPRIANSFELLPVPMTKSKGVETSTAASFVAPILVKPKISVSKPVYPKVIESVTVKIESHPRPTIKTTTTTTTRAPIVVESIQFDTYSKPTAIQIAPVPVVAKVAPTLPQTEFTKPKTEGPIDLQKLKNLEALAQIQHDTLAKLRNKQNAARPPYNPQQFPPLRQSLQALPSFTTPYQSISPQQHQQQTQQRPPQSYPQHPYNLRPQNYPQQQQQQHQQPQSSMPRLPALDILPPAPGRLPQQQQQYLYNKPALQQPPRAPQSSYSQMYSQMYRPPHLNRHIPSNYGTSFRNHHNHHHQQQQIASTTVDPSDLKYAVNSIMNAKYTHSGSNPFAGILEFLGKSRKEPISEMSDVLKALQLRANVDKYVNIPFTRPSPIPITHRPTPPPPIYTPTSPPPPPPVEFKDNPLFAADGGIFAPLKDALQPLSTFTKIMKAPLSLLPNPLSYITSATKEEGSSSPSLTSSIASSLLPDIFQSRTGPLPVDSLQPPRGPSSFPSSMNVEASPRKIESAFASSSASSSSSVEKPPHYKNSLAEILPSFLVNNSKNMTPELFLAALANLTTDIPKPFVLQPNKSSFSEGSSLSSDKKQDNKNKKLLNDSIRDILSHLNNHHVASMNENSDNNSLNKEQEVEFIAEASTFDYGNSINSVNSANEILSIPPTTVKGSFSSSSDAIISSATPKTKMNPPVEFHKSLWAREPSIPIKNLYFKIKIFKD